MAVGPMAIVPRWFATLLFVAGCTKPAPMLATAHARFIGDHAVAERIAVLDSTGLMAREPMLVTPSRIRSSGRDTVWVLDNARATVFAFDRAGRILARLGRHGHRLGEMTIPVAMDVSPRGTVWVLDAGGAKVVGLRTDGSTREFPIDFQAAGIAAVSDNDIWVAGDLRHSLFIRFDSTGARRGSVGTPVDTGSTGFGAIKALPRMETRRVPSLGHTPIARSWNAIVGTDDCSGTKPGQYPWFGRRVRTPTA